MRDTAMTLEEYRTLADDDHRDRINDEYGCAQLRRRPTRRSEPGLEDARHADDAT